MENYFEVNSIAELLKELRSLLKTGHYFGALFIALSLPDSLGKLAYPETEKTA